MQNDPILDLLRSLPLSVWRWYPDTPHCIQTTANGVVLTVTRFEDGRFTAKIRNCLMSHHESTGNFAEALVQRDKHFLTIRMADAFSSAKDRFTEAQREKKAELVTLFSAKPPRRAPYWRRVLQFAIPWLFGTSWPSSPSAPSAPPAVKSSPEVPE